MKTRKNGDGRVEEPEYNTQTQIYLFHQPSCSRHGSLTFTYTHTQLQNVVQFSSQLSKRANGGKEEFKPKNGMGTQNIEGIQRDFIILWYSSRHLDAGKHIKLSLWG